MVRHVTPSGTGAEERPAAPVRRNRGNGLGAPGTGTPEPEIVVKSAPDLIYFVLVAALAALGTVMLYSAGSDYVEGDPSYFLRQHLLHLLGSAAIVLVAVFGITPRLAKMGGLLLYAVSTLLLVAVLFFGITRGGAKRWLDLGVMTFQPSELAKTALILTLATYFSYEPERFRFTKYNIGRASWQGIILPLCITGLFCLLVALEKHLSGTVIMLAIGLVMMFLGGTNLLALGVTGIVGGGLLFAVGWLTPYTRERINGLLHRGSDADLDWQTTEGLYAMGNGGFFGLGLGNSQMKYGYVSQPQNDFIFAVVCEELGYFGAAVILLLFAALFGRGIRLAQHCRDRFCSLAIAGLSFKIILHVILNIGVVSAVLPNTGISLPFFSSGGSATLVQFLDAGLVLGLSRYCND